MFSWIHIDDIFGIILFLINHKDLDGIFNCSSPHPVTNEIFMKTLRNVLNKKIGLPSPEWLGSQHWEDRSPEEGDIP